MRAPHAGAVGGVERQDTHDALAVVYDWQLADVAPVPQQAVQ
jgi:hypothetical protein